MRAPGYHRGGMGEGLIAASARYPITGDRQTDRQTRNTGRQMKGDRAIDSHLDCRSQSSRRRTPGGRGSKWVRWDPRAYPGRRRGGQWTWETQAWLALLVCNVTHNSSFNLQGSYTDTGKQFKKIHNFSMIVSGYFLNYP